MRPRLGTVLITASPRSASAPGGTRFCGQTVRLGRRVQQPREHAQARVAGDDAAQHRVARAVDQHDAAPDRPVGVLGGEHRGRGVRAPGRPEQVRVAVAGRVVGELVEELVERRRRCATARGVTGARRLAVVRRSRTVGWVLRANGRIWSRTIGVVSRRNGRVSRSAGARLRANGRRPCSAGPSSAAKSRVVSSVLVVCAQRGGEQLQRLAQAAPARRRARRSSRSRSRPAPRAGGPWPASARRELLEVVDDALDVAAALDQAARDARGRCAPAARSA